MYNITDIAEDIYRSVRFGSNIFTHRNIVIVGDNSSGKTTLIKWLLSRIVEENNNDFYFLDAYNRIIYGSDNKNQASELRYADFTPLEIIKARISSTYLSKEDVFPGANKGSLVTYSELLGDMPGYEAVINKFFNCKIEMASVFKEGSIISGSNILAINGTTVDLLSSSEAAKIRLIMEIEYARKCNCKMVIIDEYDNSLDPDNQVDFMQQLQDIYPELRFVFVIHNFALIVQLSGMDAVLYNNPNTAPIEINTVDCDDITAIGEVNRIRAKYIGQKDRTECFLSDCVSEFIKKGKLSEKQSSIMVEMNRNNLSPKNRILYDYIVEHKL